MFKLLLGSTFTIFDNNCFFSKFLMYFDISRAGVFMNYYWPVKAMKSMKRGMMMNELKVKKVLQSLLWR